MKAHLKCLLGRIVLGLVTLSIGMSYSGKGGFADGLKPSTGGIRVTLSLAKKIFRAGEPIPVKVEIYNASGETLLLNRQIEQAAGSSFYLDLNLSNEAGAPSPGTIFVASPATQAAKEESDAAAFLKWWVALGTNCAYSSRLEIDRTQFTFLARPGRYRLAGTLSSIGGYPPSVAQRLLDSSHEPPRVPFPIWSGKVETNSVWIEVIKDK